MSELPATIPKQPALKPAEDYYFLRREGIRFIEQMGSRLWTDYNAHDPGITILEALCYAITELAYRIGWDVKDLLAAGTASANKADPYPDQAFFTAGEILTVNPTTPDDFRRLLVDLEAVRNAWVLCRESACDGDAYYAWRAQGLMQLSPQCPEHMIPAPMLISPLGLYDILLELEDHPEAGDLNDCKIEYRSSTVGADGLSHPLTIELRFPERGIEDLKKWQIFLRCGQRYEFKVMSFGAGKSTNVLKDNAISLDQYLYDNWRKVLYVTLEGTLPSSKKAPAIRIQNLALRILGDAEVRKRVTFDVLKDLLEDRTVNDFTATPAHIMRSYHQKELLKIVAIDEAKKTLLSHRNLGEDYCRIRIVAVQEVAVCADVEVEPDADIELVQAKIWFELEQYFAPSLPFYSLEEMQKAKIAVEEIFNGPLLDSGFIKAKELEDSSLKSVLYGSDIINRLMDIKGVIAVNRLQLTKYDAEGNVVRGMVDPTWKDGKFEFDNDKISASCAMYLAKDHQPRLYLNGSRFLCYKNGLPFQPRMDEAHDTLIELRGTAARPGIKGAANDLPAPVGNRCDAEDYFPVQNSFPPAYGIGPEGLPANVSDARKAHAKQLKAYLMVFEQLLGNACAQLAHAGDLFSLNPDIRLTYFVSELSTRIQGYDEITKTDLDNAALEAITETSGEFRERRNRILNHIMARFGAQFDEYTTLLTSVFGKQAALDRLIRDKIAFLRSYPAISADRARAFDYVATPFLNDNQQGIVRRIRRLLGVPDLEISWHLTDLGVNKYRIKFHLIDLIDNKKEILTGNVTLSACSEFEAKSLGYRAITARMSLPQNYKLEKKTANNVEQFSLRVKGKATEAHGRCVDAFASETDALAMRDMLVGWSAMARIMVVEHLLLRPKFPGDALYPSSAIDGCDVCDALDPYSFRLTFVLPGWLEPFRTNLDMRGFADRTILQETPSHLYDRICWIDSDHFDRLEAAWFDWLEENARFDWTEERLLERVEATLEKNQQSAPGFESLAKEDLCKCAGVLLTGFGAGYYNWLDGHIKSGMPLDEITKDFCKQFHNGSDLSPAVPSCPAFKADTPDEITDLLLRRYKKYIRVSYRLSILLDLLNDLRNVFPPATLHDWDDGSDENPVRMGKTALGS